MPSPDITLAINQAISDAVASGDIGISDVQSVTDTLFQLADMAEAGDPDAAMQLYSDFGINVAPETNVGAGVGVGGGISLSGPSIHSGQTLGAIMGGSAATVPGGANASNRTTSGLTPPSMGSAGGVAPTGPNATNLPEGWYVTRINGRDVVIDPNAQLSPGGVGFEPTYGPKIMGTYAPVAATKPQETWTTKNVQLPDGRWQQVQVSNLTGEQKVLTTAPTAPSTGLTSYQAGQLANTARANTILDEYHQGQLSIDQAKAQLEYAKAGFTLDANGNPVPLVLPTPVLTNPQNPNETAQLQEWRQARAARGEDPNDFAAFQQHMASLGAPAPSYQGFQASSAGFTATQTRQNQLTDAQTAYDRAIAQADHNYEQQVKVLGIDSETARLNRQESIRQADMNHEIALGNLGISKQNADLDRQKAAIEAAKSFDPLAYLSLVRGGNTVPGANGTELYAGSGIRPLVAPSVNVYGSNTASTNPAAGPMADTSLIPPATMASIRSQLAGANWPGGSDAEALAAFQRTAKADNPLLQSLSTTTGTGSGATWTPPAMTGYIKDVQTGQAVNPVGLPAGSLRAPSVQQQANALPSETAALNSLASYQMPLEDWNKQKENIRLAMGTGLSAGALQAPTLSRLGRG